MPQNLTNISLIIKMLAVIIGAVFALTLTGDIDQNKLKLSIGMLVEQLEYRDFIECLSWTVNLKMYAYNLADF